jgi:bacterioferritin
MNMEIPNFVHDVKQLRERARKHMDQGAITENYEGKVEKTVEILNEALATELVCVLRYKFHAFTAEGINSEAVKAEFAEHAAEELQHADQLAERITQLGGKPNMNPEGLSSRSTSQYVEGNDLVDMIKENLIAERIAIQSYRDMIRYFQNHDPTTRRLLESILEKEEEHANDMHDLLTDRIPMEK